MNSQFRNVFMFTALKHTAFFRSLWQNWGGVGGQGSVCWEKLQASCDWMNETFTGECKNVCKHFSLTIRCVEVLLSVNENYQQCQPWALIREIIDLIIVQYCFHNKHMHFGDEDNKVLLVKENTIKFCVIFLFFSWTFSMHVGLMSLNPRLDLSVLPVHTC